MVLHKYFKKAPSALPNPNSALSDHMPPEAISSANRETSGLVRQDTGQNSKTINTTRGRHASFSKTKTFLLSSRVNPYPGVRVNIMFWTRSIRLIMEAWVLCHLSPPIPLHTVFAKIFPVKSNFATDSQNIKPAKYKYFTVWASAAWQSIPYLEGGFCKRGRVLVTYKLSECWTIDIKYYVTGMGNSNLTNETMRVESIK